MSMPLSKVRSVLRTKRLIAVLGVTSATVAWLTVPSAGASPKEAAAVPAVAVVPGTMHPQGVVTIQASGFNPGQSVTIRVANDVVATVTADMSGDVKRSVEVPASARPGAQPITVRATGGKVHSGGVIVHTNWIMAGHGPSLSQVNPYENVLNPANVGQAQLVWQSHETNPGFNDQTAGGMAVDGSIGYSGGPEGMFHAYDLTTGKILWEWPTAESFTTTPLVVDGEVWVGSSCLVRFDPTRKGPVGTDCSGPAGSSPVLSNGAVYIGGNGLYALDPATGDHEWSVLTNSQIVYYGPAVVGDTAFVAGASANGDGNPTVDAVDLDTHQVLWQQPLPASAIEAGVAADGLYVVLDGNSVLHAYNQVTGVEEWTSASFAGEGTDEGMAIDNNNVYVVTADLAMHAVSLTDGTVTWTIPNMYIDDGVTPTIANGVVYIGSPNDQLDALDPATGTVLASYGDVLPENCGGAYSTTVVNGNIYVLSLERGVYDLAIPGT